MKILITGHSKWIWKYLSSDLEKNHEVFWFSRSNWFDLRKKEIFQKIKENIWEDVLDVLILNAWIWEFWNFEDIDLNNLEDIINLNLLANIRLLKTLQYNIKKETKIIFVWSIISKKFMKWASVYQASKFWLRWLAWWLKNEWKKVFLINPKIVNTDFHKWKIELDKRFTETKLEDILITVENIINWNEKRFEIDL
jgi:short-subunit dehydrogenase